MHTRSIAPWLFTIAAVATLPLLVVPWVGLAAALLAGIGAVAAHRDRNVPALVVNLLLLAAAGVAALAWTALVGWPAITDYEELFDTLRQAWGALSSRAA